MKKMLTHADADSYNVVIPITQKDQGEQKDKIEKFV